MTTNLETCERCKFWKSFGDLGDCHAHAPAFVNENYPFTARWPTTRMHDWCGDFKPNPETV